MTAHAQDSTDSVSAAKITAYGTVGVAIIGAIATLINTVGGHDDPPAAVAGPAPTTISHPPMSQISNLGSVDKVEINGSGTEVTVAGSAERNVDSVVVLVGPRASGGQYWANVGNVSNRQWKLSVATDPRLPEPYTIEARYHTVSGDGAVLNAFKVAFQGTTPTVSPAPPSNQIVNCAEQLGPNCFVGPGWGPPSVYQSS